MSKIENFLEKQLESLLGSIKRLYQLILKAERVLPINYLATHEISCIYFVHELTDCIASLYPFLFFPQNIR
jgi:hypothetical protein